MKNFFTIQSLTSEFTEILKYQRVILIVLAVLILGGLFLYYLSDKKSTPAFNKSFIKKVGNLLIFIPTLILLMILAQNLQISGLSVRVFFVIPSIIWLIWLFFLVYYRIVVLSKLWKEYERKKREEKYLKNGKGKR